MGAIAFQKGLGIVHALAHAIGGHFGCHHGLTNAVLLPYCLLYNRPAVEAKLGQLARQLSLPSIGFEGFLEWIFVLRARLDIPPNLKGLPGYKSGSEAQLATLALQDAALSGNPRPAGLDELRLILETAYEGHIQESRLSKSGSPTPRS